jgi:hypothetical protein
LAASHRIAAVLLLAYAALLGSPALDLPARWAGASFLEVRSTAGAVAAARGLLQWALRQALRFAPLGLLAVLALPDGEGRLSRALRVGLPALAAGLALAFLALLARAAWTPPGPFELVLPAAGIVLGAWSGLAWRRGWWSRLVFLPKLAALGLVLLLGTLALAALALEREPALPEPVPLASADRRHLVDLFRGKDPRKVPPGETRTLRLSATEVDQLVGWALSVGLDARAAVRLRQSGVSGAASVRVPRLGRWLNVAASARVGAEAGRLAFAEPRLRVGRLAAPPLLLDALAPFVAAGLRGDRDLRRVLPAVESLSLAPEGAALTYRRVDLPRGLVARLVWGEEAAGTVREAALAQVDRLLASLPASPEGDARFALALETAFALARERSAAGSAVEENRAALVGLGIVLGHPRLARAVGEKLDEGRSARAGDLREGTTLRGRDDWPRHFAVSGALTAISAVAPSDAAGLFKEELDADGGSGFSFADLLADRAGTTFAEAALRSEAAAAALQARLGRGFRVDEFFPPADGLPEGIPAAELQSRYGGVGGPLYRRTAEEVERRVAACAAYRD